MIKSPGAFAGLDDVLDLGHANAVDQRPALLRLLTDLYLQRPTHTLEDEHYYTELALRLIDAIDVSERAALAARLARYPSAPGPIIARLARDVIDVAGPILEHSPSLSPAELKAIAEERGGAHARIVAARSPSASLAGPAAGAAHDVAAEASKLSELFYAAGAQERRLILINLEYASLIPSQPLCAMQRSDVWRLESAALKRNAEALIRELGRTLGISRAQARRIVSDELGEPIVAAAKALNLPTAVLQRMLLFMMPWAGQSVDRIYALAELSSEISVDAARRLISIWRDAEQVENSPIRHEPVAWRTAAENARRALSEVLSRRELAHDARLRSGER